MLKEYARPRVAAEERAGEQADTHSAVFYSGSKVVGRLEADGWLRKRVDSRIHQLRKPAAWCCDDNHLAELRRLGAYGVELRDEQGRVWRASLASFAQDGFPVERRYGQQTGLALKHWAVSSALQPALFDDPTVRRQAGGLAVRDAGRLASYPYTEDRRAALRQQKSGRRR